MISNEKFWDPIKPYVSLLKFKASIGKVGNDQIGGGRRFGYNTTMDITGVNGFSWGESKSAWVDGVATGEIGNPDIEWEEALKRNLGMEINFWNDHIKFQVDYFNDYRKGIFITRQSLPDAVGLRKTQYVNIGEMQNAGVDLSGQFEYTFRNGLSLSARGNFTFNRNRRVYDDKPDQIWPYQNTAGFANNQQRGLIAEGLFMTQEEIDAWPSQYGRELQPGDIKYRDVNGDGIVNDFDMVPIGYTTIPEINYGFGLSLNWKGIDASVFFSGMSHVTRFIGGYNLYGGAATNVLIQGQVFADVKLVCHQQGRRRISPLHCGGIGQQPAALYILAEGYELPQAQERRIGLHPAQKVDKEDSPFHSPLLCPGCKPCHLLQVQALGSGT